MSLHFGGYMRAAHGFFFSRLRDPRSIRQSNIDPSWPVIRPGSTKIDESRTYI